MRFLTPIVPVRSWFLVLLLLPAALGLAQAQETRRVVVLPLEGDASVAPWALGMATGLQRALNTVDGLYVPPVGDPAVLADRAREAGLDPVPTVRERFGADTVLGGQIESDGGSTRLTLRALGAEDEAAQRTVSGDDPAALLEAAADAARELLSLELGQSARDELRRVAQEAPAVEVLSPLALASSRLPGTDVGALRAAADLAADSSWVLAELARALATGGDVEGAREAARRATDLTPSDVEAWVVRGTVARRAGEADAARSAFEEALRRNPDHAVALLGLAEAQGGSEAVATLQRAVAAYPRLLEAHLALAESAEGARAFQRLRDAGDALPDSLRLHQAVVNRALAADDAGGALQYLRDAAQDPLARAPGLYALAESLPATRAEAALAFVREGREAFPEAASLAVVEARLLRAEGRSEAAVEVLRGVVEANPEHGEAANALALALLDSGAREEARRVLQGAAESDATVRFNLGQLLLEAGRPEASAEELAPLVEDDPEDPAVWTAYGTALAASGRAEEGREALQRALELEPGYAAAERTLNRLRERQEVAGDAEVDLPPAALRAYREGLSALEEGSWSDAARAFERAQAEAADEAPEDPLLAFYRANALQRGGEVRAAVEAYGPALEAFPESGTVLNNVGFANLQLGRYDRALPTLRDAVEANPENARAHLNLGLTFYGLERYEEALDAWDRAVELEPELEQAIADPLARAQRLAGEDGP